jgi:hypothetical protein
MISGGFRTAPEDFTGAQSHLCCSSKVILRYGTLGAAMVFIEVFWAAYVPFILLILALAVKAIVAALRRAAAPPTPSTGPQPVISDRRRRRDAALA